MPTLSVPYYTEFRLECPWRWQSVSNSRNRSVTWLDSETVINRASLYIKATTDAYNTNVRVYFNDLTTPVLFHEFPLFGPSGPYETTVDVSGLLNNGVNLVRLESDKMFFTLWGFTATFTVTLSIDYTGTTPVVGVIEQVTESWLKAHQTELIVAGVALFGALIVYRMVSPPSPAAPIIIMPPAYPTPPPTEQRRPP